MKFGVGVPALAGHIVYSLPPHRGGDRTGSPVLVPPPAGGGHQGAAAEGLAHGVVPLVRFGRVGIRLGQDGSAVGQHPLGFGDGFGTGLRRQNSGAEGGAVAAGILFQPGGEDAERMAGRRVLLAFQIPASFGQRLEGFGPGLNL